MTKQPYAAVLTALVATLSSVSIEGAFAKQQCSTSAPSDAHGYWSWRLIDGRKCWYEGKPMLSKSSLEWAAQPPSQSDSNEAPAIAVTEESRNPMDSQARVIDDSETFDALWRARIGRH